MTTHALERSSVLALGDTGCAAADDIALAAARTPGLGVDIGATIAWAVDAGARVPTPGAGRTIDRWSALATAASIDVTAARVLEPHVDALAILAEATDDGVVADPDLQILGVTRESAWGVFAAEGQQRLEATREPGGAWRLDGTKAWCSLAADLTHALITAWVSPTERRLFAVSLRDSSVSAHPGPWVARGLTRVVSAPVDFRATPAVPVGDDGWYLRRRGFAWGGIGVAAVWWGSAEPLHTALVRAASRPNADQLAQSLLGEADAASWAARVVLADAARRVDTGPEAGVTPEAEKVLAERVRAVTVTAVERMLTLADHALGPGPLTTDEDHARRVSDLRLYVRQHHAERDHARLGRLIVAGS